MSEICLLSGLEALGAKRIAIVTPYLRPLTDAVVAYLEHAGHDVVDALSLEVPDNLAVARLDPTDLHEHWRRLDLTRADALVLSCCVQMPSLDVVQQVQDAAGIPVLSAATATTFRILTELGLPLVGTHHRGIDDARNIARLLPFALGRQRLEGRPRSAPRRSGAP